MENIAQRCSQIGLTLKDPLGQKLWPQVGGSIIIKLIIILFTITLKITFLTNAAQN